MSTNDEKSSNRDPVFGMDKMMTQSLSKNMELKNAMARTSTKEDIEDLITLFGQAHGMNEASRCKNV